MAGPLIVVMPCAGAMIVTRSFASIAWVGIRRAFPDEIPDEGSANQEVPRASVHRSF
jgi:hypothetical protein